MHDVEVATGFRAAARVAEIGISEILKIGVEAAARRRAGKPVIVLGAGEPDFDTPAEVKQAAQAAMERGETKYTQIDGTPQLRDAIRAKFRRENGLVYGEDEITIGVGAKQVIFNAFMATLDPGDEVIVPAPYWTTYLDIVRICGGVPVTVACPEATGFRLTAEALERAITPRTRWLMLNSPSNPSGAAYSADDLRPLLDVLLRHPHVWILSDEIYEHIVYDGFVPASPAALEPKLKARTLTVNGVSKAYAMTGWRVGFGGGPRELVKAMAVVQSQSTTCTSSVSQAAAAAALNGGLDIVRERCRAFAERRDLVASRLNAIPGLTCRRPEGAFYTFASCAGLIGRRTPHGDAIKTDADFCTYLLREYDVAVVPGSAFGLAPYFRISYATSREQLVEACDRIESACKALAPAV